MVAVAVVAASVAGVAVDAAVDAEMIRRLLS
jgi:hypothetical protein